MIKLLVGVLLLELAVLALRAEPMTFTDETSFMAAIDGLVTEDFDTDTGELVALVDIDTSFEVAGGKLAFTSDPAFHLTNLLHESTQFTAFGAAFEDVPPGVFSIFADGQFVFSRLDPCDHDFFFGLISDVPFDLASFIHSTGSFNIDHVSYKLVPEASAIVMLAIGALFLTPSLRRTRR
jgi:hypothetical protein